MIIIKIKLKSFYLPKVAKVNFILSILQKIHQQRTTNHKKTRLLQFGHIDQSKVVDVIEYCLNNLK